MEYRDFHLRESILTPEKELELRAAMLAVQNQNTLLQDEVSSLKEENTLLRERLAWLEKQVYGQKSEKTTTVMDTGEQISMFDEAEVETEIVPQEVKTTEVKSHKRREKRTHDEIMADVPVQEILHETEDTTCERCGGDMKVIGKEKLYEELLYKPAKLLRVIHYAVTYKCTECGMHPENDDSLPDIEPCHIKHAPAPKPMIKGSFCTPELLAHILFQKYCQAVPLYRQEKEFEALGVKLSRTTMANWIIAASKLWIEPIWNAMKAELLTSNVIHADETTVQVLDEPKRKATTKSRMWVFASGRMGEHSNILFDYHPTRNGSHAAKFLGDYSGWLICDGYDGYNKLLSAKRCGCWAHVRRKFVDALPSEKELLSTSQAAIGLSYCNKLFALERRYNGEDEHGNRIAKPMNPEERCAARQEHSKPVLDAFYAWLEGLTVTGGGNLAKAVQYAKNERKYLYRFLEDGNVPIDNNRAENAIRPFVVGRKNWLFSASVKGADASAMVYSVVATACANGIKVEEYLTELFREKPGVVLMPW